MTRWMLLLWLLVGLFYPQYAAADDVATLKATIEELRRENARLKEQIIRLMPEVRPIQTQDQESAVSTNLPPQTVSTNAASPKTKQKVVSLRDVLMEIDDAVGQTKQQKTTLLKSEYYGAFLARFQKRMDEIELLSASSAIEDVKMEKDGIVVLRPAGLAELSYGDPKKHKNISYSQSIGWRVKMSEDLARQLKPGTLMNIVGKPLFNNVRQPPGQFIVWLIDYGYITITDYKVYIGKMVFEGL